MKANIFQIFYSKQTEQLLDPGFIPLDNTTNSRPDWREYWPIRRFLQASDMHENQYYGFLSPKFREKTGLNSKHVENFIEDGYDVISFSPFFDQGAYYLNVFEQGEMQHKGLVSLAQQVFNEIGYDIHLKSIVMDSRHVIFSNYFVAKPLFWREWMVLGEKIFQLAEGGASRRLKDDLNATVPYISDAHSKVFII